jgi:hypothetical protein
LIDTNDFHLPVFKRGAGCTSRCRKEGSAALENAKCNTDTLPITTRASAATFKISHATDEKQGKREKLILIGPRGRVRDLESGKWKLEDNFPRTRGMLENFKDS